MYRCTKCAEETTKSVAKKYLCCCAAISNDSPPMDFALSQVSGSQNDSLTVHFTSPMRELSSLEFDRNLATPEEMKKSGAYTPPLASPEPESLEASMISQRSFPQPDLRLDRTKLSLPLDPVYKVRHPIKRSYTDLNLCPIMESELHYAILDEDIWKFRKELLPREKTSDQTTAYERFLQRQNRPQNHVHSPTSTYTSTIEEKKTFSNKRYGKNRNHYFTCPNMKLLKCTAGRPPIKSTTDPRLDLIQGMKRLSTKF